MKNVTSRIKPLDSNSETKVFNQKQLKSTQKIIRAESVKSVDMLEKTAPSISVKPFDSPTKQIWKEKSISVESSTPFKNYSLFDDTRDMIWQEVSFIDPCGIPRSLMTWVPKQH